QSGLTVMAPVQECPTDKSKKMCTVYGLLIGEATDCDETPLAKNSSSRFDVGRNFANKFWTACRFALMNISNPTDSITKDDLTPVDQWMLSRVVLATNKVDAALSEYKFSAAVDAIYDVLWRDFCDWYLEAIKPTVKESPKQQRVLLTVVDLISRLLHPVCPFVTEAIWPHIHALPSGSVDGIDLETNLLVATSSWPKLSGVKLDENIVHSFGHLQELVTAIRVARASQKVKPKRKIDLFAPERIHSLALEHAEVLTSLSGLRSIALLEDSCDGFAVLVDGETILLSNMLDETEIEDNNSRLKEEIASLEKKVEGFKNRLSNESYVNNAPEHVVQETKDMLLKAERDLEIAKAAAQS
ncbi:MAG: class I tRNA ligase family protein, partial [Phycisphaerales bacterium]|nr:class I tRNA ligase family protein [Phycisphaerales bacterium]